MGTSSRSSRRRRRRSTQSAAPEATRGRLLLKSSEAAAAGLLAGFVLLLVGIALLASGGRGGGAATADGGITAADGGTTTDGSGATTSPGGPATTEGGTATDDRQPAAGDEEAIQSLARRSIEVLPAGQWPSLYDSFTSEFQQRCPREQFGQAGEDAAVQLGDDLRLLRFKRTESVTIEGSSAQAVIVGEIVGQSEYQIQAVFQKVDGDWKIAPAANTQGCEAFGRLGG